jgi:hypothetical protein
MQYSTSRREGGVEMEQNPTPVDVEVEVFDEVEEIVTGALGCASCCN